MTTLASVGATMKSSIITGNRNSSSYDHGVGTNDANDTVDTNGMPRPSTIPAPFLFISIFLFFFPLFIRMVWFVHSSVECGSRAKAVAPAIPYEGDLI